VDRLIRWVFGVKMRLRAGAEVFPIACSVSSSFDVPPEISDISFPRSSSGAASAKSFDVPPMRTSHDVRTFLTNESRA
jgi:hypothetical protein